MTLQTRRANAAAALRGYRAAKGESMARAHVEDQALEVSDLIADLLHYATGKGYDTAMIMRCADSNHGAEKARDKVT